MMSKGKGNANGQSEVIQAFADSQGDYTFERSKMERAVDSICYSDPAHLEKPKGAVKPKKDDVQFLTKELLIPAGVAERALIAAEGDLTKALTGLMVPS